MEASPQADTELGVAAPCGSRMEANICTEGGELAPDYSCWRECVVRSEDIDSTLWCQEAAACSEVHPDGHGKRQRQRDRDRDLKQNVRPSMQITNAQLTSKRLTRDLRSVGKETLP